MTASRVGETAARASVEWVPAVYDEWGAFDAAAAAFTRPPRWAAALLPKRTEYQRLNASLPNFVPNRLNEVGVFLKHVWSRYDSLADVTLFSQGDIWREEAEAASCLKADVAWAPLPNRHYFMRRCDIWNDPQHPAFPYLASIQQCFANIAALFGFAMPGPRFECPHMYIQNKFFASRATLRRVPRAVWRAAYEAQILNGTCHPDGQINRSFVTTEAWRRHALSNLTKHELMHPSGFPRRRKHGHGHEVVVYEQEMSAVWEFSSGAVFGGQPFVAREWGQSQWCAAFRAGCAGSPCKAHQETVEGENSWLRP